MSNTPQTTPPELIKAKKVLDEILSIQTTYGPGEDLMSEKLAAKKAREIYHKRMTVIYLALVNAAMEARSESEKDEFADIERHNEYGDHGDD